MKKIICIFIFLAYSLTSIFSYAETQEPIKLLAPDFSKGKSLMESLKERKSTRSFSERDIPLKVLSNLLWAAFGINRPESSLRTAPSARNMQEIDIYVAMKEGVFLYNAKENMLEPFLQKDIRKDVGIQDFTEKAPINLIYVADYTKMSGDEESNLFYSAVDTGFISQNVYLFCAGEGLSTVVLGWVDKPRLQEIMGLKLDEKIILTQPVGYPE